MSFMLSADQRLYAQVTHPYTGKFPQSGGLSTVAGTDAIPFIEFSVNTESNLVDSNAKTSGLGRTVGMTGRKTARWRGTFPWQPSGSPGVVPNLDPLLQALFSSAPTISAGVSVQYKFSSTAQPSQLSFFVYRTPDANVMQRALRGAMVDEFELGSNDGEAVITMGGPLAGDIDSVNFASYSAEDKGDLTAFPNEPASPVVVGSSIVGFLGAGTSVDGVTSHTIRQWSVSGKMNRGLQNAFNNRSATVPTARLRDLGYTLEIFEENTAALAAVRFKPYTSTPVPLIFKLGEGAGRIASLALATSILPSEEIVDSEGQSVVRFGGGRSYQTALGQNDELVLNLT